MTAPAECTGAVHKAPPEGGSCPCGTVTMVRAVPRPPVPVSDGVAGVLAVAVDARAAHAVLWQYDRTPGVLEPGAFIQALVAAMDQADPDNLRQLSYGFPGLAAAVQIAKGNTSGIGLLRAVAGLDVDVPT